MRKLLFLPLPFGLLCTILFLTTNVTYGQGCNDWSVSTSSSSIVPNRCGQLVIPIQLKNKNATIASIAIQSIKVEGELVSYANPAKAADATIVTATTNNILDPNVVYSANTSNNRVTKFSLDYTTTTPINPTVFTLTNGIVDVFALTIQGEAGTGQLYRVKITKFELDAPPISCSNLTINDNFPYGATATTAASNDVSVYADQANITNIGTDEIEIPIKIKQTTGLSSSGSAVFKRLALKLHINDMYGNLDVPFVPTSGPAQPLIVGNTIIAEVNDKTIMSITNGALLFNLHLKVKPGLVPIQSGNACIEFDYVSAEEKLYINGVAQSTNGVAQYSCTTLTPSSVCKQVGTASLPDISDYVLKVLPMEQEKNKCSTRYLIKIDRAANSGANNPFIRKLNLKVRYNTTSGMSVSASSGLCYSPFTSSICQANATTTNATLTYDFGSATGTGTLSPTNLNVDACGLSDASSALLAIEFVGKVGDKITNFVVEQADAIINAAASTPPVFSTFRSIEQFTGEGTIRGVKGKVTNCCGTPMKGVPVHLFQSCTVSNVIDACNTQEAINCSGFTIDPNTTEPSPITNAQGDYEVCFAAEGDYYVAPCKCDFHEIKDPNKPNETITVTSKNGLSTFDAILIHKQILGVLPLDNACKLVAADYNGSKTVATSDLFQLKEIILGIKNPTKCWRFVPSGLERKEWSKYFDQPCQLITLNRTDKSVATADFLGSNPGDVNCSAMLEPMPLERTSVRVQSNERYDEGEEMVLDFNPTRDWTETQGYQMGLHFDTESLEFIRAEQGDLPTDETFETKEDGMFGLTEVAQGNIRTLWYSPHEEAIALSESQRLFRLVFRARRAIGRVADVVQLDERVLNSEIYQNAEVTKQPTLEFVGATAPSKMSHNNTSIMGIQSSNASFLASIAPNPFRDEVKLSIKSNQSTDEAVQVTISDVMGRTLYQTYTSLQKGYNEVIVGNTSTWATGIYTYTIRSATDVASALFVKQ